MNRPAHRARRGDGAPPPRTFSVALARALAPLLAATSAAAGCRSTTPEVQAATAAPHVIVGQRRCMGTQCTLSAWHHDDDLARGAFARAFDEMDRLELLMTPWRATSDVSRLNAAAGGEPLAVHPDTMAVLAKSRWVSELTGGAFDITIGVFRGLWKFDEDNDGTIPARADVVSRLKLVDYRDVILDPANSTARLRRRGQAINLGGIAKGYAVDAAVKILRDAGLRDFLVHAGGDLFASGRRGDRPWTVGIQDPRGPRPCPPETAQDCTFADLALTDAALPTAGDYERFIIREGRRYHHILDPRTGFPAARSRSVTLRAKDAFTADALDTALFVVGPERALTILEGLPGVDGIIVGADNRVHVSPGLKADLRRQRPPSDGI